MTGFSRMLFLALAIAGAPALSLPTFAQEANDDEEYKPVLPDVAIYKAMLDANKTTGWIQFRNYDDKQLIYFTALQTMHCRLSEIRYSVNSDALDKRFPLGKCNPQIPFNLPDSSTNEYIYISLPAGEAKTLAIQAVWDDGAGSEIVVYKPCEGVGDATCAAIKTIKRPKKQMQEPVASDSPIRAVQSETPGKTFSAPTPSSAARP
ncbi:hypothetical protein LJR098_003650 [Rhizobium sp. LjRoot98]|uniref:hypothetical protein n=1 Tax=unclassified Rhizobium TaxID=2613769 RepID=UPI0007135A70|nr:MULTISPECIES: hypothetical protein [unclassified Rhizobium]KQV39444.1 hypothetical protein ASC96_21060 [Rhizobium sp. Root1204]KQY02227.1 hypothetical protein ASD36_19260 [Rhizobium sp. Root1334]